MAETLKPSLFLSSKFHDMNNHRLARCSKTGILLDSLLACGPIGLKEGEREKRNDASYPQTFYYESGLSEYETLDRKEEVLTVSSADRFWSEHDLNAYRCHRRNPRKRFRKNKP